MAADQHAEHLALVAGFENGLVTLEGRQARLDDDFLDLLGSEGFEQAGLFQEEAFQINFTHAVSRFDRNFMALLPFICHFVYFYGKSYYGLSHFYFYFKLFSEKGVYNDGFI